MRSTRIPLFSLPIYTVGTPLSFPGQSTSLLDIIMSHSSLISPSFSPKLSHLLRRRRDPLAALPCWNMLKVHRVNLLECSALTFNKEEVNDKATDTITSGEDVAVTEVDRPRDEWCEEGYEKIPQLGL